MRPHRRTILIPALGAALLLGAVLPAAAQGAAPDDGCTGAVARWTETAERENKGGFMGDAVYAQVQGEIERASRLCAAGQDAEARRAVTASMRRHGY